VRQVRPAKVRGCRVNSSKQRHSAAAAHRAAPSAPRSPPPCTPQSSTPGSRKPNQRRLAGRSVKSCALSCEPRHANVPLCAGTIMWCQHHHALPAPQVRAYLTGCRCQINYTIAQCSSKHDSVVAWPPPISRRSRWAAAATVAAAARCCSRQKSGSRRRQGCRAQGRFLIAFSTWRYRGSASATDRQMQSEQYARDDGSSGDSWCSLVEDWLRQLITSVPIAVQTVINGLKAARRVE